MGHRLCRGDECGKQFLAAAQRAAKQLCSMFVEGKLKRLAKGGSVSAHEAMLEDYAFSIQGLLALYQEDFDVQWYEMALKLQGAQDEYFSVSVGANAIRSLPWIIHRCHRDKITSML